MATSTVKINLKSLSHNVNVIKRITNNCKFMAIIKANAYAHGMIKIAQHLNDKVDYFGVARLSEAVILRENGIKAPIVILAGMFVNDDLTLMDKYELQIVVHSYEQIEQLKHAKLTKPVQVWFKIDTGMHRLGFNLNEAEDAFTQLISNNMVSKPINIMSHFSSADEPSSEQSLRQISCFNAFCDLVNSTNVIYDKSLSASAGIFAYKNAHFDVVRAGISLYGVSPFSFEDKSKGTGKKLGLKAVMQLSSEIITIKTLKKDQKVGYNLTWQTPKDTKIAVVAMGYGDGYPRNILPNAPVLINGRLAYIVGRVSMDMILVDIGIDAKDKAGDSVIFWGEYLPIEQIAHHSNLSAYELLTRLTARVNYQYIE